jgi:hypothetical protein
VQSFTWREISAIGCRRPPTVCAPSPNAPSFLTPSFPAVFATRTRTIGTALQSKRRNSRCSTRDFWQLPGPTRFRSSPLPPPAWHDCSSSAATTSLSLSLNIGAVVAAVRRSVPAGICPLPLPLSSRALTFFAGVSSLATPRFWSRCFPAWTPTPVPPSLPLVLSSHWVGGGEDADCACAVSSFSSFLSPFPCQTRASTLPSIAAPFPSLLEAASTKRSTVPSRQPASASLSLFPVSSALSLAPLPRARVRVRVCVHEFSGLFYFGPGQEWARRKGRGHAHRAGRLPPLILPLTTRTNRACAS